MKITFEDFAIIDFWAERYAWIRGFVSDIKVYLSDRWVYPGLFKDNRTDDMCLFTSGTMGQ